MNEKVKVESQAYLYWESYNEGTYAVGRTKAKREPNLEKTLEAKQRKYETGDN